MLSNRSQRSSRKLAPLPLLPKTLCLFWLHDLLGLVEDTEAEPQVYGVAMKAAEAIQAELLAAKSVRRALTPEQNALVALHNKMAYLDVAVGHLTSAAEFWREVGDLVLQALHDGGVALDVLGIAYSTKARRLLCLRQALNLMSVLEQTDRKRLLNDGHQPTVFL